MLKLNECSKHCLKVFRILPMALLAIALLSACGGGIPSLGNASGGNEYFESGGRPILSNPDYVRPLHDVLMPMSDGTKIAQESREGRSASIDYSSASRGFVIASCTASQKVIFTVEATRGNEVAISRMQYPLPNDGTKVVVPLPESGLEYTLVVNINVEEQSYERFLIVTETVVLESELDPFLIPNQVVNYTPESEVVRKAQELVQNCSTDVEVAQMIYYWISHNITYDKELAETVQSGYIPDPDRTLAQGRGICYDYASLAAAMFRSQGVPAKLVKGHVSMSDGSLYHAWNEVFLEGAGWIAITVPTTPNQFERIDLTFAASGSSDAMKFIGDGKNYAPTSYE